MPLTITSLWYLPGYISREAYLPSSGSQYKLLNTFEFIKDVSDTVFDMINAAYHGKLLMFIRVTFWEKIASQHRAVNEADSCLLMRHFIYEATTISNH